MRLFPSLPRPLLAGLILAIALDTVIQITWKSALTAIPPDASATATLRGVLSTPAFYVAMVAFGAQLWNWMCVLARADLSFAQPFTALSYITVLTISSRFLHETLSPAKLCGTALILLGVFLISRTPHRTGAS